jgi:hypothetical protein
MQVTTRTSRRLAQEESPSMSSRRLPRSFYARSLLPFTLVASLAVATPACAEVFHPLTPAALAERGTHRYPGVDRDKATDACAVALETLGYKVTMKDPATGLVKTAPKTIMVSAVGHGATADVTEDGLAWSLAVEQSGSDVVVHATPRGFRNGSEMHEENVWVAEAIDSKFDDLWHEVDGVLRLPTTPM